MKIRIRLFAGLREAAGISETELILPDGASVADAASALLEELPALNRAATHVAYAVNRSYVKNTAILTDADELALIPPVSGG